MAKLERIERIVDASRIAPRVEALLPAGVRPRQLSVRTLLIGILALACEGRPAHLSRVREALLALPEAEKRRLGVIAEWRSGPHLLTYRQVERTFGLVAGALAKAEPDGEPSEALAEIVDALLEASVEVCGEPASNSCRGLDRPGDVLLPTAEGRRGLRGPGGLLGTPARQLAWRA